VELLNKVSVCLDFLRITRGTEKNVLGNARFGGDVENNSGRDVAHIPFFKRIWGRDGVTKPLDVSRRKKVLALEDILAIRWKV